MLYHLTISPKTIVKYLTMGVIILALISIPIQIGKYVFDYREAWTRTFNLDREMNLPTWYSALMLAFCALLLRVIALGKKTQRERYFRHWNFLSMLYLYSWQ
jgi:ABC-type Fe3+-siderophore transport system permease subunit